MYIGSRRELVWTLRQRAERAEAEQELRMAQARGNERSRIAREMHDVLAHRISQISLQAGALGFRSDLDADELRANAAVIRDLANEALTDLRGVLGVLRDPGTGELAHAPQPTWSDLPSLVDQARDAGLHVVLTDRLPRDAPVPDVVGRTLYRIVQEGITNAGKHAPGAVVRIEVSGSPEEGVDIVLRNPLGFGPTRTPGSGPGVDRSHRARRAPRRPARGAPGRAAVRAARVDTVGRLVNVTRLLIVDDDPLVRVGADLHARGSTPTSRSSAKPATAARAYPRRAAQARRRAHGHPDAASQRPRARPAGAAPRPRRRPRVIVLTTFDADEHVVGALRRRRPRLPAQGHRAATSSSTPIRKVARASRCSPPPSPVH